MKRLSKEELESLADYIKVAIKNEFRDKHLSGNLMNTIAIEINSDSAIRVVIPAQTYNMLLFQQKHVIVHTSRGSYASKLDLEGSSFFVYPNKGRKGSYKVNPRNHIGYIDRVIDEAITNWLAKYKEKYELKSRKEV